MKNIAMKLLVASTVVLTSACAKLDFPSLIGEHSSENGKTVIRNDSYKDAQGAHTGTFVGQKTIAFGQELEQIKVSHQNNREELAQIQQIISTNTTQYNNTVGSIESKLQIGTTPNDTNLRNRLRQAQNNVQTISVNTNALNSLSIKAANDADSATYLVDSIRAAFNLSGADDKDHRRLRNLLNKAEQLLLTVNRTGDEINGDSAHRQQYLISAQKQLARLSAAIRVGRFSNDAPVPTPRPALFGKNNALQTATITSNKPLFVAKFKNDNFSYKEGLSTAVKSAVKRKSNTFFEVLAVSDASSVNKAQRQAHKIFKEITAMGVNSDNINLSAKTDDKTDGAEVWIFVR